MDKGTILITGVSQRLGLALATSLIEQDYQVVASYRTKRPTIVQLEAAGAHCIQTDFSTTQAIDTFADTIANTYPSLRAIIHNASDWMPESDKNDASDVFDYMMQIHAKLPYLLNLKLQHLLLKHYDATAKAADIIHLTDYVVSKGSKKHIAYAASKAALHNLTLSFAQALAPQVKVNSIAPALLMFNENDDDAYKAKALKKSLLQITPGEQAGVDAVNYLLNSTYITGSNHGLDGGRHLK
ncbi:dihydromonapterin reductase [Thalassotalea agarivorans]|uniref:Dihydromonapterin reductase n=1 Tax=Thalassotalea agarivorans TaxID=349064 RepID=A0A1I0H9N4_THASX|nr:dihydromonapterin reductase [Thalassotalea agarivorans]SET80391.1 dihydromonapterin reductase / dihydrofolate reductase [Thalassotalea agarivorans]